MEQLAKLEQLGEIGEPALVIRLRHAEDGAMQLERFHHRQIPQQVRALAEHHADALHIVPALAEGIEPGDRQRAAVARHDADQKLDEGGLAGAIGAHQPGDRALLDVEGNAVERGAFNPVGADERAEGVTEARPLLADAIGLARDPRPG